MAFGNAGSTLRERRNKTRPQHREHPAAREKGRENRGQARERHETLSPARLPQRAAPQPRAAPGSPRVAPGSPVLAPAALRGLLPSGGAAPGSVLPPPFGSRALGSRREAQSTRHDTAATRPQPAAGAMAALRRPRGSAQAPLAARALGGRLRGGGELRASHREKQPQRSIKRIKEPYAAPFFLPPRFFCSACAGGSEGRKEPAALCGIPAERWALPQQAVNGCPCSCSRAAAVIRAVGLLGLEKSHTRNSLSRPRAAWVPQMGSSTLEHKGWVWESPERI